jgi:hypothetical protein
MIRFQMPSRLRRGARRAACVIGEAAGFLQWHVFRNHRGGQPLNAQLRRVELVRQLVACCDFNAIIETGTHRGVTTAFLRHISGLPVFTVELASHRYGFAKQRFRRETGIHSECGDSRTFLEKLARDPQISHDRVFFYLDAHGGEDLPITEELEIVVERWSDPVIMIDDFEVRDDPGYGFDDYGARGRLTLTCLPPLLVSAFELFWPAAPADSETGARRGCLVTARRGLTALKLAGVAALRRLPEPDPADSPDQVTRGASGPRAP